MTTTQKIASVTIDVARDSMGGIDMADYLWRLEQAIRAMPGVTGDTEVGVFEADVTRYEGLYENSPPHRYDELTDRLQALAEDVFSQMCRGK